MLKRGDTPEIEEVFKEGKKIKAWENYDRIWHGTGVDEHINLGERMENRLLSSYNPKFNTDVGHKVGIRAGLTDRLTNWVSGTIAAWFSQQVAGGKSFKSLLGELADEKAALRKDIPADIVHDLGLAHVLGVTAEPHKAAAHHASHPAPKPAAVPLHKDPVMVHPSTPKKSSLGWLWWLLGIILLGLIIFWCVRSCGNRRMMPGTIVDTLTAITSPANGAVGAVAGDPLAGATFQAIPMVLPDGTKITMYKGRLEDAVKSYLDSDKFKNATEAELRSVWFEFSDIDFEHNSATELMPASKAPLDALIKTLSGYPNVKIKIGAFGDKTGNRAINYAISEQRALNIEAALEAAGCPRESVSVEGFGKEYASIPVTASNDERAPDRDIAMRFTK
jgi:outer membrane protein OmpA-like peptidoglycan-associated protein